MSAIEYIKIDEIPASHPVQAFHQYWQNLSTQNGVVAWDGKLISVVPEAMSWASILVVNAEGRYLCRFCGAAYEQMIGLQHQGMYLDEALPRDAVEDRVKELMDISKGKGPLFSETTLPFEKKEYIHVYRGIFGFSTGKGVIDRFVTIIAPKTSV